MRICRFLCGERVILCHIGIFFGCLEHNRIFFCGSFSFLLSNRTRRHDLLDKTGCLYIILRSMISDGFAFRMMLSIFLPDTYVLLGFYALHI